SQFALRPHLVAVALDDVFHDGEPETGRALLARTGLVDAVKPLEHPLQRIRNARAVVLHAQLDRVIDALRGDLHRAVCAAVLDRVDDEIAEYLLQLVRIGGSRPHRHSLCERAPAAPGPRTSIPLP